MGSAAVITLIVILTAFLSLLLVVLACWLLVRKSRGVIVQRERDELRRELLRDIPPLLFAESSSSDAHSRDSWQNAVTPGIRKIHTLFRSGSRRRQRIARDVAREVLGELNEAVIGETQHRIGYLFERMGFVEEELSRLADRRWWVRGEAARRLGITLSVPLRSRYRTLTVGISLDQACVDGETLAADQTGRNARRHQTLEHATEDITLAKALVAGA